MLEKSFKSDLTMELKIGFVGFGEVGFRYGDGLHQAGIQEIYAYDIDQNSELYGELIHTRAKEAGVTLVDNYEQLCEKCTIIFSAVTGAAEMYVVKGVLPFVGKEHILIDMTATKMDLKEEEAAILHEKGCGCIDAQIVSPVPENGYKATLFVSGDRVQELADALNPYGMDIRVISDRCGDAAKMKMLRSVYTKGTIALLLEMLYSAKKVGSVEALIDNIAETMDARPFRDTLNRYVCEDALHAKRRIHEMEDVCDVLRSIGIDPIMSEATKSRIERSASYDLKEYFGGESPENYNQVLSLLESRNQLK